MSIERTRKRKARAAKAMAHALFDPFLDILPPQLFMVQWTDPVKHWTAEDGSAWQTSNGHGFATFQSLKDAEAFFAQKVAAGSIVELIPMEASR